MKKKPLSPKDKLTQWAEFFSTYWHVLNDAQRESYIAMLEANDNAPKSVAPEDLPGMEQKLLMQHMGKVIKKYRELKGYDQKDFAEIIGKKSSHLSLIESGEKMFTAVDISRVSQILNIPLNELLLINSQS